MISNSQFFKGDLFRKNVGGVIILVVYLLTDNALYLNKDS